MEGRDPMSEWLYIGTFGNRLEDNEGGAEGGGHCMVGFGQ